MKKNGYRRIMANHRAAPSSSTAQTQGWPTAPQQSSGNDPQSVRAQDKYSRGNAATRNKVRQWHELLAVIARLAVRWDMGETASTVFGVFVQGRPDRLV